MSRPSTSPRTSRRRRWRAALTAVALGAVLLGAGRSADAGTPVTINVVTVNDFHGRIERDGAAAGAAALSTAVKQIRAGNPNTVFAAAGDLIGASTFTSFIAQDVPTIAALSAAGLEVSAVGNHELDQGWSDLVDRVMPLASWEYLAANLHPTLGQPAVPAYWTTTFDGITVGFIGAVTDELPALVSPAGIAGITVETPVVAANRVADQLRDGDPSNGEADVVILLVHEGATTTSVASATDPTTRFGQLVNGANANIDAIVSGHTHLAYNHVIAGRPVISSGQYGEKFGNMTIQVDSESRAILSMSNVVVDAATAIPPALDDPAVTPIVAAAVANANVLGAVPLGTVTADFNRGVRATGAESRGAESTLGNFVADVQLWAANQIGTAQIAFMNPGGLRTDIKLGDDGGIVTYREAANVQPFANTLNTLTLTGAQVKTVLEQQWQPAGASRPFLKLGVNKALTYTFDPARPSGDRVTRILLDGQELDPAADYRIVVNSFLAAGGDSFFELANGREKVDTGKVDLQSMVDWFAAFQTATPDAAQRAVALHVAAPSGYVGGAPLTVDLASLDFTTNEVKSGAVEVSLGGVPLGTFPVDSSVMAEDDLFDLTGRVAIATGIPGGLHGPQTLAISAPATGTAVSVPLTLVSALGQHQTTVTSLEALLPGADKSTAKRLSRAILRLSRATAADRWLDPSHPADRRVFDEVKQAVRSLTRIKNPSPEVLAAIDRLWKLARTLAETAIEDAAGGTPKLLAVAAKAMARAAAAVDAGKLDKAIRQYGLAWKAASAA
ncbi:MAG: bifunctional metallophosphatase/5'-nucleotidase [bacterium]|nr:bifunctional metallophosphatase/5'-nucleotidase [bacterium]